jgi:hypothetical protein
MKGKGWEIHPMGLLVITVLAGLTVYLVVRRLKREKQDRESGQADG